MHKRYLWALAGTLAIVISALSPALAGPPPAGWTAKDIGTPDPAGSTDVTGEGAAAIWTVSGAGADIWGQSDNFHYAYQTVKGNATITARFQEMEIGHAEWTKIGLMVRESDAADSPNAFLDMTSGHGLQFQLRPAAGVDTQYSTNVQGSPKTDGPSPVWMRVQRVGNDVSTYHSQDGKNWTVASLTLTIPTLKEDALIGIANTSHEDGTLSVAKFDNVSIQPGSVLVHGIKACGADKSVVMEWKAIEGAESYNIYRAAAGETDVSKFVRVTDTVIAGTTYTDASAGLENGTEVAYLIAPVKKDADGNPVEGERVRFLAKPDQFTVAAPPGFATLSTNEGVECGVGPSFNAATGEITLRGSGGDIWDAADRYNFTHQELEGNFQITVKALTKPTQTHDWAKAGLMIRESLAPGSRNAYFVLTPIQGLSFQYREETDLGAAGNIIAIANDDLAPPLMIRMTRTGDLITGEYSLDDGKTWEAGGEIELPGLEAKVDVGLAITSHNAGVISEAKFQNLTVTKL